METKTAVRLPSGRGPIVFTVGVAAILMAATLYSRDVVTESSSSSSFDALLASISNEPPTTHLIIQHATGTLPTPFQQVVLPSHVTASIVYVPGANHASKRFIRMEVYDRDAQTIHRFVDIDGRRLQQRVRRE